MDRVLSGNGSHAISSRILFLEKRSGFKSAIKETVADETRTVVLCPQFRCSCTCVVDSSLYCHSIEVNVSGQPNGKVLHEGLDS